MSASRGWNAQADDDLLHLADAGFALDSMAWALNRTPGTIRARLLELQWTPPPAAIEPRPAATERPPAPPRVQVGPRKLLGF